MKKIVMGLVVALSGIALLAPDVADARRLGGGGTSGMKRQTPPPQPQQPPAQQAAPQQSQAVPQKAAPAAAAPTAASPKRSWMGPLAGLAAGLGIAALLSHFGLGGAFADLLTMVLIAIVAFVAVRWLLRRFAPAAPGTQRMQLAGAPAGLDDLRVLGQELVGDLDALVEETAAVVAQVEQEPLHPLRAQRVERPRHLAAGRAREVADRQIAGVGGHHVGVADGRLRDLGAGDRQLERLGEAVPHDRDADLRVLGAL